MYTQYIERIKNLMDYKPNGSKTILIDSTKKCFESCLNAFVKTGQLLVWFNQNVVKLFWIDLKWYTIFEKKCTKVTNLFTEQTLMTIKLICSDWNVDVITFIDCRQILKDKKDVVPLNWLVYSLVEQRVQILWSL